MSDIEEYLAQHAVEGEQKSSDSSFTIAGAKARAKLAESIPYELRTPWAAMGMMIAAFKSLGLEGDTNPNRRFNRLGVDLDCTVGEGGITAVSGVLRFLTPSEQRADICKRLKDALEDACNSPMQGSDVLTIYLSRAILIMIRLELDANIYLPNLGEFELKFSAGSSRVEFSPKADPNDTKLMVIFAKHEAWHLPQLDVTIEFKLMEMERGIIRNLAQTCPFGMAELYRWRSEEEETKLTLLRFRKDNEMKRWQLPLAPHNNWTRCPSRAHGEICFNFETKADWFHYRLKKAVLLEYLIPAEEAGPIVVSEDSVTSDSGLKLEKPSQSVGSWERFITKSEHLISRKWESVPEVVDGKVACRAIFSVVVSEYGSKVILLSDVNTHEVTPLKGVRLPPGLCGVVYWPGLKPSLYGDAWDQNEAYEEALEWAQDKAKTVHALLKEEFYFIWGMLTQDHVRKSYLIEVHERLKEFYGI